LAAVLGSGDIHLFPVPHPTALDPAHLPCDDEVRASLCCLAADLSRLLSAIDWYTGRAVTMLRSAALLTAF